MSKHGDGIVSVWAGDLGAYNQQGLMVGDWVDLPMEPEALDARLREISPDCETWGCFDRESDALGEWVKGLCDSDTPRDVNDALGPLLYCSSPEEAADAVNAWYAYNGPFAGEFEGAFRMYEGGRIVQIGYAPLSDRELGNLVAEERGYFDALESAGIDTGYLDVEQIGYDYRLEAAIVTTDAGTFELVG